MGQTRIKNPGIYKIVNTTTDKYYIGSTLYLPKRWTQHKKYLRKGNHPNDYLQHSWNKYGIANFNFIIVENLSPDITDVELLSTEQKYLDIAKTEQNKCYNLTFDAFRPSSAMSEYSKNKWRKKHTTEHNKNISLAKKGIPLSTEHKQKLLECCVRGEKHPRFDNTEYIFTNIFTNETIKTTRLDLTKKHNLNPGNVYLMLKNQIHHTGGWSLFPEIAKNHKRTIPNETRQKISSSLTGLKKSDKHKTQMSYNTLNKMTIECPHCHKIGQYVNMKRWHFDNCKLVPEISIIQTPQS